MNRTVIVLRPAPGDRATIDRLHAASLTAISLPLFDVVPLDWTPPDPAAFDQLLLTSANALRHGGPGLAALRSLPVLAVGAATADTARAAGFEVAATGTSDAAALLADLDPATRLLWLAGQDRTALAHPALAQAIAVYRAEPCAITTAQAQDLTDGVALLHSARAARHLAAELDRHGVPRTRVRLAALSGKVADAAGAGWAKIAIARSPNDDELVAVARSLAIDP